MEPLAWGLERFDGAGASPRRTVSVIVFGEDGNIAVPGQAEALPFSTIGEMMGLLSDSPRLQDCMSLKAAQFAVGRLACSIPTAARSSRCATDSSQPTEATKS